MALEAIEEYKQVNSSPNIFKYQPKTDKVNKKIQLPLTPIQEVDTSLENRQSSMYTPFEKLSSFKVEDLKVVHEDTQS